MKKYRSKLTIAVRFTIACLALLSLAISASAETSGPVPAKAAAQQQGSNGQWSNGRIVTAPPAPNTIKVREGFVPFLVGHGDGTQNYVCRPTATGGFAYVLFTPQATLFNDDLKQLITHFFSPNPQEPNTDPKVVTDRQIRVTWQAQDTSTIWAKLEKAATFDTDPTLVKKDAVAWLLLDVVNHQDGPNGGATLSKTQFVQRVNTTGGLAPSTGCASPADAGNEAFVHYTADYVFYRAVDSED
jgi:hypothetical protein